MNTPNRLSFALLLVLVAMVGDAVWCDLHPGCLAGLAGFGLLALLMCWLAEKLDGGAENYPGFVYDLGLVRVNDKS